MIEVRGLTKRFGGVVAIDELSFHLPPGSRTALLGPNAAGKSTLLAVLSTLAAPSAGEARPDAARPGAEGGAPDAALRVVR